MPVFNAVGLVYRNAKAFLPVRLVLGVVPFEPDYFAIALKGKDVGGYPV